MGEASFLLGPGIQPSLLLPSQLDETAERADCKELLGWSSLFCDLAVTSIGTCTCSRTHTHTHTNTHTQTHTNTHTLSYMLTESNQISYLDCQAVLEKTFSSYKIDGHSMLAAINCCIIRLTSYLLKQFGEHKSLGIYKNHLIMSCINFKDVLLQALFGYKLAIQSPPKMFPMLIKS